ncbi:MAG: hypothetical protein HOQ24_08145, partial [Mycobacteriaceae bacterium]|nr:hypothetical protein [Mycobacteriaceae bacterium]
MLGAAVVPRAETPRTKPGPILVSTAVTSVGMGVFGATSFLYYTRVVRVPATTMGAVLTVVGLAAIAVSLCLGRYLDGKDMVKVNVGLLAAQAAGVLGVAAAGFAAPLAVAVGVVTVFTKLVVAARRALLVRAAAGDDRRVL